MPELPEVETIARGLAASVSGDVIESIWLGQKPEPLKSSAREIAATLEHSRISTVRRMGKHIVFDLESARVERAPSPARGRQTRTGLPGSKVRSRPASSSPPSEGSEGVRPTQSTQAQWIVHLGMTG